VIPVGPVLQYPARDDPLCEQFEDIEVNGQVIRVSKGGLRRYYHNLAIEFIKKCDYCFKMVCDYQQLVINKGFYVVSVKNQEEWLRMHTDNEISEARVNCMSMT
jgi:hypothetical protein